MAKQPPNIENLLVPSLVSVLLGLASLFRSRMPPFSSDALMRTHGFGDILGLF